MEIQRESMEYDVVIVGAGPAGLSTSIKLKQINPDLNICILEKGSEVGAHILSGNVFETRALDELIPENLNGLSSYSELIKYVEDRPGHDVRYAIDASKIKNNLGWEPKEDFLSGIRKTVQWYLDNLSWSKNIQDGSYKLERIGVNLKWKGLF